MTPIQRAGYLAYARQPVHRRRVAYALRAIRETYRIAERPYVSFSAGKDSSALLHLVATVMPDATARMLVRGETHLLHRDFPDLIDWFRERFPRLDLATVFVDRVFSEEWSDASWLEQHMTFVRVEWTKLLKGSGDWDCSIMGLRNEESGWRAYWNSFRNLGTRYPIRRYSENRTDENRGAYASCPISYWREKDVGAYIATHDIPMLEAYDNGIQARTHSSVGRQSVAFGQLSALRERDPASYKQLIERFPELARYT